jgi:hypothetical protein
MVAKKRLPFAKISTYSLILAEYSIKIYQNEIRHQEASLS